MHHPIKKMYKVQNLNMLLYLQLKLSCIVSILIWNRTSQLKFVNQWTILHIEVENLHNRSYHETKLERKLYCETDWYSFDNYYMFLLWIPTLHLNPFNILDLKSQIFSKSFQVLWQSCTPLPHKVLWESTNKIKPSAFELTLPFLRTLV